MQLTYPGVYIQELSSGVHAIAGVATSIAAFVGYTARGLDNTAIELFSFADYERSFGGLASDSELSYAVQQFFANGGTTCFVVRVPRAGSGPASLVVATAADTTKPAFTLTAKSTGAWANNLTATVDFDGLATSATTGFNLTLTDLVSGASESFANVTLDSSKANFLPTVVNDPDNGSALVTVTVQAPGAVLPVRTGVVTTTLTGTVAALNTPGTASGLVVAVAGQSVPVTLYAATDVPPAFIGQALRQFEIKVARALQAAFPGAQVSAKPVKSAVTVAQPDVAQITVSIPGHWDAVAKFTAPVAGTNAASALGLVTPASANVAMYWIGGTPTASAWELTCTPASDTGALPDATALVGDQIHFSGIYALDKVDLFNILCMPDATRVKAGTATTPDFTADQTNGIFAAAMEYCIRRRAFLIIDPPPNIADIGAAIAWKTSGLTVHDLNGAAYFPRVRLSDPLNQMQLRTFAPCGVVAGIYARTDGDRGVWKAPAGTEVTLSGVQKLVYTMNDGENGALNPLALNCFRTFPVYGTVSWGARTLVGSDQEASEWKYVPVRRIALFLEESLYRGLKWAVFEPNDNPLWAQIRLNVGSFMNTLFRQGAFRGLTPKDAYFVRCDSSTTTQADIDNGVVNVIVGFAPLKPAEFVVLKLQQIAGQTAA